MSESIHIGASGDHHRPIRISIPGRDPLDVTSDELVALQHEIRCHLLYRVPGPPVTRLSNSGG